MKKILDIQCTLTWVVVHLQGIASKEDKYLDPSKKANKSSDLKHHMVPFAQDFDSLGFFVEIEFF